MAKETFYFSHDFNARGDRKMVNLLMTCGVEGIGIYWCIVEMLYEEGGYLNTNEYERIAFELRTTIERIEKVVQSNLFVKDEFGKFWSISVLTRIDERKAKSDKARESISYRWNNTNVKRTNNGSNTIKESKGKEIKGVSFSEEKDAVILEDGTKQKLGDMQKFAVSINDLKPQQIHKGQIS